MTITRPPAVAGLFYPADPLELRRLVHALLATAAARVPGHVEAPKALIAPHAGYIYSGAVAASAYALLRGVRDQITRVVLLGPAHRYPLRGLATHGADAFETPLGSVPISVTTRSAPGVQVLDAAHVGEHSLEVHLPFLQVALGAFTVAPIVVGLASPDDVAAALRFLWGGPETLIVISSDLSHFHTADVARALDADTARAITEFDVNAIASDRACGSYSVRGLLELARSEQMAIELLDLRNSADTAGSRERVVGYGAFAFR